MVYLVGFFREEEKELEIRSLSEGEVGVVDCQPTQRLRVF